MDLALATAVAALAFATGVSSKFADTLNEHGISWFRGAGPASGLVWGPLALALCLTDRLIAMFWVGTVLFWFLTRKLDRFNHAFAGVCVVVAGLHHATRDDSFVLGAVAILAWLSVSSVVNTWLKIRFRDVTALQSFLRLRLRFYAGPIALGVAAGSALPVIAILFGMAGTELVTVWHHRLERRNMRVDLPLGIVYDPRAAHVTSTGEPCERDAARRTVPAVLETANPLARVAKAGGV